MDRPLGEDFQGRGITRGDLSPISWRIWVGSQINL